MSHIYVIICLFFSNSLWSQSGLHIINHYTNRDGLSNAEIYCIEKDSRGFIWLGTKEGLNRFDGLQFIKYFSQKNNPQSLAHNFVFDLLEYKPGKLLVATANGLCVLNTLTGQFENEKVRYKTILPGSGVIIASLYKDGEDNIWVNHSGEIDVLDNNLNWLYRFTDLEWAKSLKGTITYYENWISDRQNRLWLPSDTSGISIIDFVAKKIYNSSNNPLQLPYLERGYIRGMLLDEERNTLWVAPWGSGLIKYDLITGQQQRQYFNIAAKTEERSINWLVKFKTGNLLCTINGKVYEVNPQTLDYQPLVSSSPNTNQEPVAGTCALYDGGPYCWIAGSTGLYQVSDKEVPKQISLANAGECNDLILSSGGILYAGFTNKLLVEVEKNRRNFRSYTIPSKENFNITEVCEDQNQHLWIGTMLGLWLFDIRKKSFSRPLFLPAELLNAYVNLIFCDKDGDTWIGTRNPFTLYRYDMKAKNCEKVENKIIRQFGLMGDNNRISAITEDSKGTLWMVSHFGGGLISYEKKSRNWKLSPPGSRHYNLLTKKGFFCIETDDKDHLWLNSSFGDGLLQYDNQTDSVIQFTREDGLLSDYIYTITPDKSGDFLLTTEYGITRFNPDNFQSHVYTLFDKFIFGESLFDPASNSLVIGSPNQLQFITDDSSSLLSGPPLPFIDKINVNNQQQFIEPGAGVLKLSSWQKNISIDFTAIRFANANKLRFAYQLSGVDDDWKYAETSRTAQYSILTPGNYTFRVKAANEDGVWNPEFATFSFSIAWPWWQTVWFRVLGIFVVGILIFYFVRRRIKFIRHEAEMKQQIAETEMMALRAQMNPHFIFNCINSIDALIQSNDKYNATIYLNKFAKLIRNILDSSRQNLVPLSKDIETLKFYIELEQFRNENKFTSEINIDESVLRDDYKVPPLVIQPYVENAILHGLRSRADHNGRLNISISRQNGYLKYLINDNGTGRPLSGNIKQQERKSYGIQMSSDRIKLFNGENNASVTITDLTSDGKPAGTCVQILLKIQ